MHINRRRPKKGDDLEMFLAETINDALRDAVEAGLPARSAAGIALSLGRHAAHQANMQPDALAEAMGITWSEGKFRWEDWWSK